ncbi:hypothetical protein BKA65DRAFT_532662 [Rhexocercosporidium sp. MPI-PUGE-AT-0058]|nr:hypothetical protein BKA65DRAFT_532662 [Rhexocercosporidium sp. MPI-PUGE-AT-0058]
MWSIRSHHEFPRRDNYESEYDINLKAYHHEAQEAVPQVHRLRFHGPVIATVLVEQYKILVEATRNAVRLAGFSGGDLLQEDRPFNKFFVRNSVAPKGGRWTSSKDAQNVYASIHHNMILPSRFPLDGTGKRRRRDRIGYQCKDTEYLPPGSLGCAGNASAYTANNKVNPTGWTIVFCPRFFTSLTYLNRILARPNVRETELGNLDLVSYEQAILHEWLHNDIMGFNQHLTDIVDKIDDNGPRRKVYGMSEARDYAWKFMRGGKMKINKNVAANVENYVWYFVDKLYGSQWGWTSTGNSYPRRRKRQHERDTSPVQADALDLGDESTDPSTLPVASWPENCHGDLAIDTTDTAALLCDYSSPPNNDPALSSSAAVPVASLPSNLKSCNCDENGCTAESPACCYNGTC